MGLQLTDIYGGGMGGNVMASERPTAEIINADQDYFYGPAPAISWAGVVMVLIALRVLYELAEEG